MIFIGLAKRTLPLLALGVPRIVNASEPLPWAVLDFPPFQVLDGEFRGSGSFDGLLDLLTRKLPDFDHEVQTVTFARREEEIRQGRPLCTPGIFKTPERELHWTFSIPALVHLDNRLVFLRSKAARLQGSAPADLDAVAGQLDLVAGVATGRSFAPTIDATLRKRAAQPNIVIRPMKSAQIYQLMVNGEIDYSISFPHEAAYFGRQAQLNQNEVLVRPIAGAPPFIFTYVACTKGPWGDAVIGRVNTILRAERSTAGYRSFSERWYRDDDKGLIKKYYSKLLEADK